MGSREKLHFDGLLNISFDDIFVIPETSLISHAEANSLADINLHVLNSQEAVV
jgi:hypothetical protein